ncbi:MAG: ABC transporter substrate-binding protein [Polyangiaceae bacterium]|nr:ABC transporter substrate-binding protein [Polyangiaceae bacterium]
MKNHFALVAAAGLALGAASGTLIVDRSAAQCESDADCAGFAGTVCSADSVCVPPPCSTHQDCVDRVGEYHVCHERTRTCVALRSDACQDIEGDYSAEDAFFLGALGPTEGASAATGQAEQTGIKLAISDFEQASNGLPPNQVGGAPRPIVLVGCNDGSDGDAAVAAAQHLVDVGVPAIIGAAYSGITIKVATEVTIPGQVLLISPSATSVAITDLADNGLVWRTAPSDVFQALAMTLYVPTIEAALREAGGPLAGGGDVKIAILNKGDAYGSGLAKAVEKDLVMNGMGALDPANQASYLRVDYGDPDDASKPTSYPEAVQQALALQPHIVLLLGTAEGVGEILPGIEEGWSQAGYRPRYVLSDGGVRNELWGYVGSNDDLRRRVTGTVPGTSNILFNAFKSDYNTKFPGQASPDVFGAAGAYDATYLLAYSAVTLGAGQVTGPALAQGLKKMVPPAASQVEVGTDGINGAFATLKDGEPIDFVGASGPLDFDVDTGEAPSDIQIWCLPSAGGEAQSALGSGLYLDAATSTLMGAMGAVCD